MSSTKKILIINDNHFISTKNGYEYIGSKFHLFLKSFSKTNVFLSSPIYDNQINNKLLTIDTIKVFSRTGYGQVLNFYKKLPITIFKYYRELKEHISQADSILLIAPACTLPISYLICRLLNKPLALYIVGDVVEVIKQDKSSFLPLRLLKLIVAKWEWFVTRYISKKHTTFCLGSSTYNKLSRTAYDLKFAMTSLVSEDAIVFPQKKITENTIYFLSVSRLSKEKGIEVSLEAIANLSRKYSLIYTIIGDGPEMSILKQKAIFLGLEKIVIFTGYLDQLKIRKYYLNSDIFLIPSLSEGIPKVILDAMASATSVIGTKVGGIPDLLGQNQSRGWLVEPNNPSVLESAIRECINNNNERYSKALNANAYIKKHTISVEAGKIESVLLGLMNKNIIN